MPGDLDLDNHIQIYKAKMLMQFVNNKLNMFSYYWILYNANKH